MSSPGMISPDTVGRAARRSADDGFDTRPTKRNRVTIACTRCRNRKSRCDGVRPKCSACSETGADCVYSDQPTLTKTSASKELLEDLRSRLATLEHSVAGLDGRVTRVEGSQKEDGGLFTDTSQRPLTPIESNIVPDEVEEQSVEDVDQTDGIGSITFAREEESGYFGSSSNIAFTRQIIRATASILKSAAPGASPVPPNYEGVQSYVLQMSRGVSSVPDLSDRSSINLEPFALPPEGETMLLIEKYFRTTGVLFPYINEAEFFKTYRQLTSSNVRTVRRSWLGLLNIVLAMSTHASHGGEMTALERCNISDTFFHRAMALCDKQIRRGTSIEVVQLLLLMSQYLQGTERSIETWNVHGLAVKAAYQLGLHSPNALRRYAEPEREFRKRTWFGCVLLDRTLSMTFGRPPSIPEDLIKIDLPSPTLASAHLEPDPEGQSMGETSVHFYRATITLYQIMGEVINILYGNNLGYDAADNVFDLASVLLQFEQKLLAWQSALPTTLTMISPASILAGSDSPETLRLRFILTIRFLNLRILTHRVMLSRHLDALGISHADSKQLDMLRQVSANSIRICGQSALELVKTIRNVVSPPDPPRYLLGAWWFALYYTFNAALVIYSTILVEHQARLQNQRTVFEENEINLDHLHEAIECLSLLFKGNRMTDKCVRYTTHLAQLLAFISGRQMDIQQSGPLLQLPTTYGLNIETPSFPDDDQIYGLFDFTDLNDLHLGMASTLDEFFGADFSSSTSNRNTAG
ncbi:fungal-specific transcription factor domain-containing protein [Paraphoma chrysanthemicola]|uniref:Fungal-specific transcription factor domain-containing protein n=1 Tax=Paraphoma chrysanthemicola TaxID=798071 RepID=A0A8K0R4X6_9PLEO|nr:fungal-specific transcription factor domain-containing protein [Paraphoma chrysanthemicola]